MPALRAVVAAGHEVALVVTQPDRRRGRGAEATPSPVKAAALELALPVRTPERAREVEDEVRALDADLGVVVAFGQLLPVPLLEATRHGFVNVHFSLLPRWRGAAPVERAILAGDAMTGVCVMQLEAGLDTGPVYSRAQTPIAPDETAGELRARLIELGTDLLLDTLPKIASSTPEPQTGDATHAAKLTVEEFRIDPLATTEELVLLVRAGSPRPGAWAVVDGRRLKVWRAHRRPADTAPTPPKEPGETDHVVGVVDRDGGLVTADGVLDLDVVQPEGKAAMPAAAWLAGWRSREGAPHPTFELLEVGLS